MVESDPSVEFVLHCLAKEFADAREALAIGAELKTAIDFALHNEVIGELLFAIESENLDIPAEVVQAMHTYLRTYPIQRQAVRRQTMEIARIFDVHGIDYFIAKGALWSLFYRDAGIIRTTKDVDVYLNKIDLIPAVNMLEKRGYACRSFSLQESLKHLHHYSVWSPDYGVHIELHWRLAHPRHNLHYDLDQAISRRITVLIDKQPVPILKPCDAIVFLALELSKDSWMNLKKILDFSRCVSSASDKDLKYSVKIAQSTGCFRALSTSLLLSQRLGLIERSDNIGLLTKSDRTAIRLADICENYIRSNRKHLSFLSRVFRSVTLAQKHDRYRAQLYHIWRITLVYRLRKWIGFTHK